MHIAAPAGMTRNEGCAPRPLDDYRIHAPPDSRPRHGGEFVLYWMQTTQRAHDNFALNFAIEQADALGLPLQVYHGLRHDYPWASDRFHTWILEGVIDLYAGFAARGINYAFWLDEGSPRPISDPGGPGRARRHRFLPDLHRPAPDPLPAARRDDAGDRRRLGDARPDGVSQEGTQHCPGYSPGADGGPAALSLAGGQPVPADTATDRAALRSGPCPRPGPSPRWWRAAISTTRWLRRRCSAGARWQDAPGSTISSRRAFGTMPTCATTPTSPTP